MAKTLLIGLGGLGGRIVSQVRQQAEPMLLEKEYDLYFTAIDKDEADLSEIAQMPTVNMQLRGSAGAYMEMYDALGVSRWCKVPPYENLSLYGAGMRRAVGRLAFLDAMENDKLTRWLHEAVHKLYWTRESNEGLQVVVVTSLAGGTGSGAFIQLALWIRKNLRKFLDVDCAIYGYFLLPEVFTQMSGQMRNRPEQCARMQANTYAALRELEQITNIRMGKEAPEERICLDGLFDSAQPQDGVPVYDRVYLYDGQGTGEPTEVSLQTHIDRIADALYCRFVSYGAGHLSFEEDQLAPFHWDGQDLYLIGAAMARYPKNETVEYCARRMVRERVLRDSGAPDSACAAKVETYIRELRKAVEAVIDETHLLKAHREEAVDALRGEQLEQLARETMAEIENEAGHLKSMTHEICMRVMEKTAQGGSRERWSLLQPLLMEGNHRAECVYAAPETVRCLLRQVKAYLGEKGAELSREEISFFQPGPVPVSFGKDNMQPQQDLEYPLVVLRQNNLRMLLLGTRFGKSYLNWFRDYCRWQRQQRQEEAAARVLEELYAELLRQAEAMCDGMKRFDDGVMKLLDADEAPEIGVDLHLAADSQTRDAIFAQLPPVADISELYSAYFEGILAHIWDMPENDRWIREGYQDMLKCLRAYLLREAADVLDLDPIRALLTEHGILEDSAPGGANFQNAQRCVEDLCRRLYHHASVHMYPMCEISGHKIAAVGVSRDSEYLPMVRNCLAVLRYTNLEREYSCFRNQIWCLVMAYAGKLSSIPKMRPLTQGSYADAYRWLCRRNDGEPTPFDPHIDPALRIKDICI